MICKQCGRNFRARGRQKYCPQCKPPGRMREPRACKYCGEAFVPKKENQIFCSKECRAKSHHMQEQVQKICPICGGLFEAKSRMHVYCSQKCYSKGYYRKRIERPAKGGPDRELTPLSVYLIHKDFFAGQMKLSKIAVLYNRSIESVRKALNTPLPPDQEAYIEICAKEQRRRRARRDAD